jgi:hypothetical protein
VNRNLVKSFLVYAGIGVFALVAFQNCSDVAFKDSNGQSATASSTDPDPVVPTSTPVPGNQPSLSLVPNSNTVPEGQNVLVTVNFANISNVGYVCKDKISGNLVLAGNVSQSGQQTPVKVDGDLHCEAQGVDTSGNTLKASGDIAVNCGNRVKNPTTLRCEDFACKTVVTLLRPQLDNVPKRTSEGICYALKIFDRIPNSLSTLTTTLDTTVISRDHEGSGKPRNPFAMGIEKTEFRLEGPRSVKLSGGLSDTARILVDNFVLMGVYPSNTDPSGSLKTYYKVMGTKDSSIMDSMGNDTNSVQFMNTLIPIQAFGPSGTSSLAPVDITTSVQPAVYHKLDIRALDCGGSRELSDIYLLFQ